MIPTKQTVYIPKEITEEFCKKYDTDKEIPDYELIDANNGERLDGWVNEHEGYFFTPEQLNEYTANVIKQALETAAEKAKIIDVYKKRWSSIKLKEESFVDKDIHKESITNTFEETFKKFKV